MKKILITVALAIVSIVIAVTAFNHANAYDIPQTDPKVTAQINSLTYEQKIKKGADYMGISVQEAEAYLAVLKPSCRANYNLVNNQELTKDEQMLCSDLESVGLFDKK